MPLFTVLPHGTPSWYSLSRSSIAVFSHKDHLRITKVYIMSEEAVIQPQLHETFYYHAPFRIMICRPCQCGVFDKQVAWHLCKYY